MVGERRRRACPTTGRVARTNAHRAIAPGRLRFVEWSAASHTWLAQGRPPGREANFRMARAASDGNLHCPAWRSTADAAIALACVVPGDSTRTPARRAFGICWRAAPWWLEVAPGIIAELDFPMGWFSLLRVEHP